MRYSEKVPVKGLNSVIHIELDREYANTTNEDEAFIFVPDTEDEYIYTGQSKIEASVWEIGIYDDGGLKLTEADISQNRRVTEYSLNTKKGCLYLIRLYEKDDAFTLQKAKKLNGLELLEAPKQSICLPGSVNTASMKGLTVSASYTDGTTEDLTYGTPDSSGRYLYVDEIEWLYDRGNHGC